MSRKWPLAQVFEQPVPVSHGGEEKIRIAIVVDVGKGRGHRDRVLHEQAGLDGHVFEATASKVPVQPARAELGDEVEIGPAIPVDVRCRDTSPVVVMIALVFDPGVVDERIGEGDAAPGRPIGKGEVVEGW
jgi:hypothetical protein